MGSIFTKKFFLKIFLISALYLIVAIYLMNFTLVVNTLFGVYPLSYKFNLLLDLLAGMWTAMTHTALFMLTLNSLLTGAILVLLGQKITALKKMGKLRFAVGGGSILGIVGSGCTACGLPILSLFGLSGAALFLPFKGGELPYISFLLLLGSLYLILKSTISVQACVLQKRTMKKKSSSSMFQVIKGWL